MDYKSQLLVGEHNIFHAFNHVPFYDMDSGVFATRGWKVKEDWT